MNLVLLGFMGAGKSTIASLLAQQLQCSSVELDEEILAVSGRSSIPEIFSLDGEQHFRDLEAQVCQTWGLMSPVVISTGGGVIGRSENISALRQREAFVVYLHADFSVLAQRVQGDPNRPLFANLEAAKALYNKRLPMYQSAADLSVDTSSLEPGQIVAEILKHFPASSNSFPMSRPPGSVGARVEAPTPTASTKVCVIWGDPVSHSLSPRMHNEAYRALGIADQFVFVAAHVEPHSLADAIAGARAMKLQGVTCTLPHKQAVIPLLDELDELAQKVGAVNTVVRLEDGRLKGYNTDVEGIVLPLLERTTLQGKRVGVLGAGGAARAAAFGVRSEGAEVLIFNRTLEKAAKLAQEVGASALPLVDVDAIRGCDILIQTTSVGMTPHEDDMPISSEALTESQIVFDAIYTPWRTRLLREAQAAGATVIPGAEMFLYQGVAQFEKYTGGKAPVTTMKRLISEALNGEWHLPRKGSV